jgi:hypothetical protein
MKICSKCKVLKDESEFYTRPNGRPYGHCKTCQNEYSRQHYLNNIKGYVAKAGLWNEKHRKVLHQYILDYLSEHPCVDCGERDAVVLQFDHVRGSKRNSVAALIQRNLSLDVVKFEIEKCEVRCANCHLRKTSKQLGFWKQFR